MNIHHFDIVWSTVKIALQHTPQKEVLFDPIVLSKLLTYFLWQKWLLPPPLLAFLKKGKKNNGKISPFHERFFPTFWQNTKKCSFKK